MARSYRDEYTIRQGRIKLYRRTNQGTKYRSDNWYAAFKVPGHKTFSKSLKTPNQIEAEQLAETEYYELCQKAKKGMSLKSKKFSLITSNYLEYFRKNVEREAALPLHEQKFRADRLKNKELIANNYLLPYFKDKSIQDINDFDIESYKEWRNVYWISGEGSKKKEVIYVRNGRKVKRPKRKAEKSQPSYSTVNKELTILREIFEYARLQRFIEGREIPIIKNIPRPKDYKDRKPGLTSDELDHLLLTLAKRHEAEINPKHKRHIHLLIHYILFMCFTGLRVSEAKNLRLSDCEQIQKDGEKYLKVFVRSKGKSRELIGLKGSSKTIQQTTNYHRNNAKKHSWQFDPDMFVFVNQYGKQVKSFANGLNRAFADAGLLHDKHGIKRTAGTFRKYYITTAILNKVDYFQLAKQCGTSVGVIEKYYAEIEPHYTPEQFVFPNFLTNMLDADQN